MNYNTDNPEFHKEVFSEVGNIMQVCYNYLNADEAEKLEVIYAIGNLEANRYTFKVFFQIRNELFKTHQIKDKDDPESQLRIQQNGTEFLIDLIDIFETYNQKPPTQIKIQFFANKEEVKYQFEYDLLWSNKEDYFPSNIFNEWFEHIKNELT